MSELYFDQLSKKARKRVNKATLIWDKNSDCQKNCIFEQTNPGRIDFSSIDQITGMSNFGDIEYDKKGQVKSIASLFTYENGTPDFYYSVAFKKKKDFKKFAKASFKRSYELSDIINTYGFNKQIVADWIDSLPGANPKDPFSTAVDFGGTYEFAFA